MVVYSVKDEADLECQLCAAGDKLVVIDFYATWCGPCKMIAPKIEEMSQSFSDVVFLKVDVDENDDLAVKYDVTMMPTFVFLKKKEVLEKFSGASDEKLLNLIQSFK